MPGEWDRGKVFPPEEARAFGRRLRIARLAAGYGTAKEAAGLFGSSANGYPAAESGWRSPVLYAEAAVAAFGGSAAWYLGERGAQPPPGVVDDGHGGLALAGPRPGRATTGAAARLRAARVWAGHRSVSAAARALGIPNSTYSKHELGRNPITSAPAKVYAAAFAVDPEWLMTGAGPSGVPEELLEEARGGTNRSLLLHAQALAGSRLYTGKG